MVYEKDRVIIEDLYRKSLKKSPMVIYEKARELGHKILLADVKVIISEMPENQVFRQTKAITKAKQVYPILVDRPFHTFQCDIMYMTQTPDKRFKYIFNVIDCFSRYVWSFPLYSATSEKTAEKMKSIFDKYGVPRYVSSDNGSEHFGEFQKLLEDYKVGQRFSKAYNSNGAAIVERFNLTLRRGLRGVSEWAKKLPSLIEDYNNTVHSTTKRKPIDVQFDKSGEAIAEAKKNIYERAKRLIEKSQSKVVLKPGDKVRIRLFDTKKGLTKTSTAQIWSDLVYTIERFIEKENGRYVKLKESNKLYTVNQVLRV